MDNSSFEPADLGDHSDAQIAYSPSRSSTSSSVDPPGIDDPGGPSSTNFAYDDDPLEESVGPSPAAGGANWSQTTSDGTQDNWDREPTSAGNLENTSEYFNNNNPGEAPASSKDPSKNAPEREKVVLKRRMGLAGGVALIVGSIIGSGIFVSPGKLLENTGSVSVGLIVWVACGVLSLLGALAYAELGGIIPLNGGEYVYFYESMKHMHPFFGPLPGFLFIWVNTILLKPSSAAILTLTFAKYLLKPIWDISALNADLSSVGFVDYEKWATKLVATACVCLITFINCYDVKLASRVQIVFTSAKVLAMGAIICGGIVQVAKGSSIDIKPDFEETAEVGKLAKAFYSGLWAYDGWNQLNFVTEELENPYRNLPRAIMIAMPVCMVCYLFVNIAYLSVMTAEEIISSSAVGVDFGGRVFGSSFVWLMPLVVAVSTYGSVNGSIFAAGRLPYSAAKEDQMPEFMGYVNVGSLAPSPALIFNGVMAICMIMAGDISRLIDFFSFTAWIFYGGAMVVLVVLRYTKKDFPRPYKVNILIPIFVALISVYLVIGPIIDDPQVEYLYPLGFIAFGVIVYTLLIYRRYRLPGMKHFTYFLQKAMNVVPTDRVDDEPLPPPKKMTD